MKKHLLRELPSVDQICRDPKIILLSQDLDQDFFVDLVREEIGRLRQDILNSNYSFDEINEDDLLERIQNRINSEFDFGLKKVINGTGVVLHTNLGRAPMPIEIKEKFDQILYGYCNLEYEIANGVRGSRHDHLKSLILKLTGAEDVIVVNNNAAAVMLVLSTLCKGGEVIVSRGELVEIGGSFRIPKVMEHSGAILKEVGATNKTHLRDYAEEINENTAALMKVHTSNFKMMGFTSAVSISELKPLANANKIPLIDDLGSGVFVDLRKYGLEYEPTIIDSLNEGSDIVTFSGDKLLGGPQCGIIVGKKELIAKMKKNNLLRALRVDKMTITALCTVLEMYLDPKNLENRVPVLKMISQKEEELKIKADNLLSLIQKNPNWDLSIAPIKSQVGGGSLPAQYMNSYALTIRSNKKSISEFEKSMRITEPHIVARVANETYCLDVRTIFQEEIDIVANKITKLIGE